MLEISDRIRISDSEFEWTFVRSSGPGGQNVNKVASRAVLRWHLAASPTLPEDVKARLQKQQRRRITTEGDLVLSSQRFRDQGRNVADCLEKIRVMVVEAATAPKPRRPTRPTRASRKRHREAKRHRSAIKKARGRPVEE